MKWQSLGAPRLHIVDLDGAATGEIKNLEIIRSIAAGLLIPTQLGGGIRDIETVSQVLKTGVERVILSTAAVENPDLVREACRLYRESVIVSLDALDGNIAIHGWRTGTELNALDFARSMIKLGVRRFIYTDISRDGTLTEPDFSAISELMEAVRVPVVAAGGVSSLNHLKILQKLGAEGAIVGKAVYTGDIDLQKALAEMNKL